MLLMQYNGPTCGALESSKPWAAKCSKYLKRNNNELNLEHKLVQGRFWKPFRTISYEHHKLKALIKSDVSIFRTTKKDLAYRFMTETGSQLKVLISNKASKHVVYIELVSLLRGGEEDVHGELVMSWGIFRSNSSSFMPLDFQQSSSDYKHQVFENPFVKDSVGRLTVKLEFDAVLAPFYVSFLLKPSKSEAPAIRSHRKTNFVVPVGFGSGRPSPLGLSFLDDGSMNFALFSRSAERVILCLYSNGAVEKPTFEIDLDPYVNRSGDIWHALIDGSVPFVRYGYRCSNKTHNEGKHVLLDPYAKVIEEFGSGLSKKWLGKLCNALPFDWSGDSHPNLPLEKLVVYRLNVMQFTNDRSSMLPGDVVGTFSGVSEKMHHFKDLGVNAILLEPIFPFDEQKGPYFPSHFFSIDRAYAPSANQMLIEKSMKEMVKKLHINGIEVLLEVIFTHTGEIGALAEIDNLYCRVNRVDVSESRNMLNCNHPVVQQMILENLRHWVIEYHIDGFSFVNASSLTRDNHGAVLSRPPLVETIAFDPLLSNVKIIADTWDPHLVDEMELVFPHWRRWAEMNAKFCVDVRNFLRGQGFISNLATRLCGSGDIFLGGRGPAFSFNFITRNVGLTLVDLVSFSGSNVALQLSWNCGEEGATNESSVLKTRLKQIRNCLFILFISLGVPVLNMGDECGQSCGGSTEYSDRKPLNWNALRSAFGTQITQFISFLSSLKRRRSDLLQRCSFLKEDNIEWNGTDQSPPSWDDPACKFLAMTLKSEAKLTEPTSNPSIQGRDLFLAFNAAHHSEKVTLPPLPDNVYWVLLVDTALPYPGFFSMDGVPLEEDSLTYEMESHSCLMLEARRYI